MYILETTSTHGLKQTTKDSFKMAAYARSRKTGSPRQRRFAERSEETVTRAACLRDKGLSARLFRSSNNGFDATHVTEEKSDSLDEKV